MECLYRDAIRTNRKDGGSFTMNLPVKSQALVPSEIELVEETELLSVAEAPVWMTRRKINALPLSLVVAIHVLCVALVFGGTKVPAQVKKAELIHATLIQAAAQQAVTEEAKPLPPKAKAPTLPKRSMIAAPMAAQSEPASDAVSAPAPSTAELGEVEQEAAFVEARADADYLSNPAPIYPRVAKRAGQEGRVLLRVFVEADGKATEVKLEESSGVESLDSSAIAAVSQWTFVPAKKGTEQVAAWVLVPIVFKLRGKE